MEYNTAIDVRVGISFENIDTEIAMRAIEMERQ